MKSIAILTEDFSAYHDLIRALRVADVPFESLVFGDAVPERVGAIITTEAERHRVPSPNVVVMDGDARQAVASARRMVEGKEKYGSLILGVDPGEKPGFAVIADGEVLYAKEAESPEAVADLIQEAIDAYPSASYTARVGHAGQTHRDRILNALAQIPVTVEIVDEAETTGNHTRMSGQRNIAAAITIAMSGGERIPKRVRKLSPTDGEIQDLQQRSRERSEGRITISQDLARKVASGEMSMENAIRVQKRGGA